MVECRARCVNVSSRGFAAPAAESPTVAIPEPKCPWCGAGIEPGETLCLNCMKRPADHPSRAVTRTAKSPGVDPPKKKEAPKEIAFELELDLPGKEAPKAQPATRVAGTPLPRRAADDAPDSDALDIVLAPADAPEPEPAKPKKGRAAASGLAEIDSDDDDDGPGLGAIALADDDPKPAARDGAKPRVATAARQPVTAPAKAADPLEVDDGQVALLAAYGPLPSTLFESLRYAFKVMRRKRELRRLYARVGEEGEQKKRQLQVELVTLLDGARAAHPDHEGLEVACRPIADASRAIADRAAELELTKQQYWAHVAKLDAELDERAKDSEKLLGERRTAQVLLEDANATRARVRGDLARIERDHAAASEAAAKAAGDAEFAPPDHARRIADLDAKKSAAAAEVEKAEGGVAHAEAAVGALDRQLRDVDRRVADVHARRRALDQQADAARDAGTRNIQTAEQQRLDTYEAALRRAVELYPEVLAGEPMKAFEAIDAQLLESAREVEKHRRAIDAYDKEGAQKGLIFAVAIALALLIGVVMLLRMKS